MANNIPKHGEPIIERQKSALGGEKLIASFQFQRFLDELGELLDIQTQDDSQQIFSISVTLGAASAKIEANSKDIDDLLNYLSSVDAEVNQLKGIIKNHVDSFSDLEQVVYGS